MSNLIKFFNQFSDEQLENIQYAAKEFYLITNKGWNLEDLNQEIHDSFETQTPKSWKKRPEVAKTVILFNRFRTVSMTDKEVDNVLEMFKSFADKPAAYNKAFKEFVDRLEFELFPNE